jgi:phosphatidylserine/phosphatidylglycerophosphate/cardiolipin synthase-like enzyme
MKMSKSVLLGSLAAILVGCAGQTPMMNTVRPINTLARGVQSLAATAQNQLFTTHFVNAYAATIAQNEPIARQDPNGPGRVLLGLIQNARQTLDGAFYDIGDEGVVDALIAAKARGVRVRLVTDNESLFEKTDLALPKGVNPPTRGVILALQKAGIPVIDDQRSGLMHNKFLIVDGQAVWMGSTNVTRSSLYNHNNNAMVLRNPQVTANYGYEFERMFTQKIFGVTPRQVPFPVIQANGATIRTFFSPRGGGQEAILDVLSKARKRIRFMTFSFTDKAVADLMIRKRAEGVVVEGVYDQCLAYGQYSTKKMLGDNGIVTRHDGNEALLHHKVIIVDDTVVTGSFNFSANADKSNNENMLIVDNAAVAVAYNQEFDRVAQAAKVNRPPVNKCPGDKPDAVEPTQP